MNRLWLGLLLAAALSVPGIHAVSATQERPSPVTVYTVKPGDTLWKIAAQVPAGRDRRKVVFDLMERNGLRSAALTVGQQIELPAR